MVCIVTAMATSIRDEGKNVFAGIEEASACPYNTNEFCHALFTTRTVRAAHYITTLNEISAIEGLGATAPAGLAGEIDFVFALRAITISVVLVFRGNFTAIVTSKCILSLRTRGTFSAKNRVAHFTTRFVGGEIAHEKVPLRL